MSALRRPWVALAVCALISCGDDSGPGGGMDALNPDGQAQGDSPQGGGDGGGLGFPDGPPCEGDDCSCPPAQDSRCGDPCSAPEDGCLCTCGGGGPNFTSCGCIDGFFECFGSC